MDEIKELERKRNKLVAQREVREAMRKRTQEKRKLKAEIRKEKFAKTYKVGSFLKKAGFEAIKRRPRFDKKDAKAAGSLLVFAGKTILKKKRTPKVGGKKRKSVKRRRR